MRMGSNRLARSAVLVVMGLGATGATGATLTYDASNTAGVQTTNGTWDLNTAANWIAGGGDGTSRIAWTNGNAAEFVAPSGSTITVDGAAGQVAANGLVFSGTGGAGSMFMIGASGSSLRLGAGGMTSTMTNQIAQTSNSGRTTFLSLVLTDSQTWSSTTVRTHSNGAALRALGNVSSLAGVTNLTIDGRGIADPFARANTDNRVGLLLGGTNSFAGTTTVTGGASLWLDYALVAGSGSKLDDSRALILAGGSVVMNGGSNVVEVVGATTVQKGGNTIYNGSNGAGSTTNRLAMGAITHQVSGTFDVSNAAAGIASTTMINTSGILGGWATVNGGDRWAVGSTDGSDTNITNIAGTNRATSATWATATDLNVNMTGSESGIGSQTINALRLGTAGIAVGFATNATLILNSGGLIAGSTGQSITGGKITTAAVTSGVGELFVHTPNAFTIGSAIVNNGTTPTALVKGGINQLKLTGTNTYTGKTYLNGGSLSLDEGGSIANGNIVITAGTLNAGTTGGGGTINFNLSNTAADLISISGGVLDLTNLRLNLVVSGTLTPGEYVLVDQAVGSSFIAGVKFANVTNLGTWSIDYNGTAANPGSIVLAVPEPGSAAYLALAAGLFLRRRRLSTKRSLS
jgi:fibronectin-binding autotransporter adhesin